MPEERENAREACPFLVPVVADRLWVYPIGAYCRRPGHRVRAPGRLTIAHVCTQLTHFACKGFRASCQEEERPHA